MLFTEDIYTLFNRTTAELPSQMLARRETHKTLQPIAIGLACLAEVEGKSYLFFV